MKRKILMVRIEADRLAELNEVAKSLDVKQAEIVRDGVNKEVKRLKKDMLKKMP